jgi:hypothetical protein
MNEDITKKNLDQSIELISEFNFDEEDYEIIFEKLQIFLKNPENYELFKKISEIKELENEGDLKAIMKKLLKKIKLNELNKLLKDIIENEEFVDFIQDLFLEKLL